MKYNNQKWNGSWLLPIALVALSMMAVGCQQKAVPTTFHKLACAGIYCGAGQICDPSVGVCVASETFCQGITCGVGQICGYADGKCVDNPDYENPCTGLTGEGELVCNPRTGLCVQKGTFCQGVTCHPTLQSCQAETGICVDANPNDPKACNPECAPWETCFEGLCVSSGCQDHGECPSNMECVDGECSPATCVADYQCEFKYPGVCGSAEGSCTPPSCQSDAECPGDVVFCVQGTCGVPSCGTPESPDCTEGYACLKHACVYLACQGVADCETVPGCEKGGCACDSELGQCVLAADGCYSDGDCTYGDQCFQGECVSEAFDSAGSGGTGETGGGTGETGGDEPEGCDPDQYTCNDGQCIPGTWECDDYDDCAGAEDEADCPEPEPFCGDGDCGANETCENCADDCGACPVEEEGGEEGEEEGGGNPDSCEGNCDANAGNCWCDSGCVEFGDCCADICEACGYCEEPPTEEEGGEEGGDAACNATDNAIYQAGTVEAVAQNCLPGCAGGDELEPCATDCISTGSGLTPECSGCFSTFYICMFNNCTAPCTAGTDSQPCEICLESNGCTGGLETCSGISL